MAIRAQSTEAGPLLERDEEMRRIGASVAEAVTGAGATILIEGPAGIGKTRLLAEANRNAEEADARTLSARATEIEREFPFGVVRQLLAPVLRESSDEALGGLFSGAAALASRVFEDQRAPEYSMPTADAGFASLHGLYWLVSNLAEAGPLQLAIDDVHWADEPSLRFLAFLAPRLAELPVAVVLARRTGGAGGAQAEILDRLAADPVTVEVRPEPLSLGAVAELLEQLLDVEVGDGLAEAVHASVAGNPLFLRLLAEELIREDAPAAEAAERVRGLGPQSVARTVLLRFGGLSKAAPEVARAVAVLGDGADPARTVELSGLEREQVLAAADELSLAGILEADRLSFTHPLVRNALYEDIGARRRSELHRRAARLLADAGAPSEQVASHLLPADPDGDPEVVNVLRSASRMALSRGASAAGGQYLRRALREPPPPGDRAAVLYELGSASARSGAAGAREELARAFEAADDTTQRVITALELSQVLAYAGDIEGSVRVGRETLAALGEDGSELGLRRAVEMLLLVLAETDASARNGSEGLLEGADRAVQRLGPRAPRGLLALVSFERALVSGTAEAVVPLADAALADGRLFAEQGPEAPHTYTAAGALVVAGREQLAVDRLGEAVEHASARGSARGFALASAMRAWARVRLGALTEAEADARVCLELAPGPGWELFQTMGLSALIDVLVERGELDAAAEELGRAHRIEAAVPESVFTQPLREAIARLEVARQHAGGAESEIEECRRWELAWGAENASYVDWRSLAALNLPAGREEAAERRALASEQAERARRFGAPRQLGSALRAQGLLMAQDEGVDLLHEAVRILEGSDARLEHARALVDLGAALRRAKHRKDAREPLRQGQDLAHRCGATALAERAGEELRATGARPRNVVLSGVDSLTASERRVARLAADGLSNPEIAQALFVTRKTVESHMRSVFRKLDISSRNELPALLSQKPP